MTDIYVDCSGLCTRPHYCTREDRSQVKEMTIERRNETVHFECKFGCGYTKHFYAKDVTL